MRLVSAALLIAGAGLAAPLYVEVDARYVPAAAKGAEAAIAVTFLPTEAGIVVNETPAPRLALDPEQTILVDRQPPRAGGGPAPDPAHAKYLDPKIPVRFPVAVAPGAAKGLHRVAGSVTYFFCSKREGWCRKGTADVAVDVKVE